MAGMFNTQGFLAHIRIWSRRHHLCVRIRIDKWRGKPPLSILILYLNPPGISLIGTNAHLRRLEVVKLLESHRLRQHGWFWPPIVSIIRTLVDLWDRHIAGWPKTIKWKL